MGSGQGNSTRRLDMEETDSKVSLLWIRQVSCLYSPLSTNISREICAYLPPINYLVAVENTHISYFNFRSYTFDPGRPFTNQVIMTDTSRWTVIDKDRVALCAGRLNLRTAPYTYSSLVYLLHVNGNVQRLPLTLYGHQNCGIVYWKESVYLFGSYGGRNCESIHVEGNAWTALPDMQDQRCDFTPIIWGQAVYLCGGSTNSTIEVYDGSTLHLLSPDLYLTGMTVGCLYHDSLLLFIKYSVITVTRSNSASQISVRIKRNPGGNGELNRQVVIYNHTVYMLTASKAVNSFPLPHDKSSF